MGKKSNLMLKVEANDIGNSTMTEDSHLDYLPGTLPKVAALDSFDDNVNINEFNSHLATP